ncbi:ArgE/DapE family deacylase [Maledivibacter halophilus]|uniref:Probable succinyl-diaminopimelate desuccinylase n=1 Tax=Maledivibacter halophilus TaxID=36842 RepID=A0A1T5KPU9_9FIRM|nr:ArgE/DapE family deacylase [Maledivibacter halophilus]SKC65717.1 succinyl-diaminopimelate desuccinylase [Maledivibacter halophilus]
MNIKKELWKEIDNRKEQLIDLCCQLIKMPTENPPGEMEDITEFICKYLEKFGVENKVHRPKPNKPNIVAKYGNEKGKKLIFNGHADVVPAGDLSKWDFDPYCGKVKDGKILGRGTSDMKAGLGGVIFVMGLLAEKKIPLDGQMFLTVVPDEEISGELGTKWIVENNIVTGDACVVAEPTGYDNCEVGQRGTLWVNLKAEGTSAHGSLSPYVGDNAIEKLIKVLEGIKCLTKLHGEYEGEVKEVIKESKIAAKECLNKPGVENIIDHVTVNIGQIKGGTKTNMVPDSAQADVDIRIPLGVSTQRVIDNIDKVIEDLNLKGITYTYSWRSEPNNVSINSEIVKAVKRNTKDVLGIDISATYQWASSDARYFRSAGIPTIQYGPANTEGIHSYNETVDVKDVINAAKVYAGMVLDMLVYD